MRSLNLIASWLLPLGLLGCGDVGMLDADDADDASAEADGDSTMGTVELELTTVPTSVACVQIVLTGSTAATQKFTVTAGTSSVLNLGALKPGSVTLTATAYNVACTAITATNATWIADAVTTTVSAGLTTNVNLTLRPNSSVNATVDFAIPAVDIAAGGYSTYAVMADGTVRAWGDNSSGQLGDGSTTERRSPVTVPSLTNVKKVSAGRDHACALLGDGTARCWGDNSYGQLGDNTTTRRTVPVAVTMPSGVTFKQLAAGGAYTCALDRNDYVYCWGSNVYGQLGDGSTTNRLTPVSARTYGTEVRAGLSHTCAVARWGEANCWGHNGSGQFGNDGTENSSQGVSTSFRPVVSLTGTQENTCALTPLGAVLCAGRNLYGTVGDGTTTQRLVPTAVAGLSNVKALAQGAMARHHCAVRGDGLVFCWGYGTWGQLGNGTTTDATSPAQVLGVSGAVAATTGGYHTCALTRDGSVYCWGSNGAGRVGDGTDASRFTAVKVPL